MAITTLERAQLDALWSTENSFFNQFNNVSLPLGGLTHNDFEELFNLVAKNKCNTNHNINGIKIAEVGAWTGLATCLLSLIAEANKGKVYSIDWFKGSTATNLENAGWVFNIRGIFDKNLAQFEQTKTVEVIQKTSEESVKDFGDGSLDVVFLDADHRYQQVKRDIELWLPKLKQGGLLCGHDCEVPFRNGVSEFMMVTQRKDIMEAIHPGVCKAVGELGGYKTRDYEKGFTIEESLQSSIWYYVKP